MLHSHHRLSSSDERRRARRAAITIAVKNSVGKRLFLCQAGNISPEGMLLAKVFEGLFGNLPRCWLEFSLPDSDVTIAARGEVVRQKRNDRYHVFGVRFRRIAPSHRRLIESYIADPNLNGPKPAFNVF